MNRRASSVFESHNQRNRTRQNTINYASNISRRHSREFFTLTFPIDSQRSTIQPLLTNRLTLAFRSKSLRTASNMFIVSLAVFDLLMSFEMPMFLTNCFLERMIGWELGCDIYATLGSISGMGQAITNAAIAFDRYRLPINRVQPCSEQSDRYFNPSNSINSAVYILT